MKTWVIILLVVLFVLFILLFVAGYYFCEQALNIKRISKKGNRSLKNNSQHYDLVPYTPGIYCQNMQTWYLSAENKEEYYITNEIGLKLHAFYFPVENNHHRYVIALHGYNSKASNNGSFFDKFNQLGISVLAPDARAHGQSEGTYTAMGYFEKRDIVEWCNFIIRKDPDAKIFLYGVSMGAATVMFTVGEKLPEQVKFAVEDCGYSNVQTIFAEECRNAFHIPSFPLLNIASLINKVRMGFFFYEASTIESVSNAKIPMLFIHGTKDKFVPCYMVDLVYDACPGPKEKLLFEAAHARSSTVDPDRYWNKISEYIEKYL